MTVQSFTYCSAEGVRAVKDAFRASGDVEYRMTFSGTWTENYQTVHAAAERVQPPQLGRAMAQRMDIEANQFGRYQLNLAGEIEFDAFVDVLVEGEPDGAEDRFGDWLSSMAETLDIEFI